MFRLDVQTPTPDVIAGAINSRGARLTVERANSVAERAAQIGQQIAERELHDRKPDRRGERRGSIHYSRAFSAKRASGPNFPVQTAVANRSDIAHIIENGSRPHIIEGNPLLTIPGRKSKGGGLPNVFGGRSANTVVKSVNHPGTRAYKVVERATLQALREHGIRVNARS